ncbi:VirB3 family type IV secretion system protein [Nitrosospira sp. NRS527]|uniref:VirB3 family type IV secretion system protein n=1 Tax=Nitrosospira sp. NRS527 TaxID=155925 RepID=UPI001AF8068A|nr:VirB3 family type IV secretion system protein [Nitrosospira sp. NRS527]BCT69593.1 hypothetical protein NNRS527_03218 [Nitrosospira sp. NRS527]
MSRATIYPTLWQPILTAGVPRDYAIFALIFAALGMAAVNLFFDAGLFGTFFGFLLFGVLWALGWFFAKIDPEFFSVGLVKLSKVGRTEGNTDGNRYLC